MKICKYTVFALAVWQMLMALYIAGASSFADGGTPWDRIGLAVIQPVAALLLLVAVQPRWFVSPLLAQLTTVMLAANITANTGVAVAILSGTTKGDWFLPLGFIVIPTVGLIYLIMTHVQYLTRTQRQEQVA